MDLSVTIAYKNAELETVAQDSFTLSEYTTLLQ